MAKFRLGRRISVRWNGLLFEGPALTVFEVPDEYNDELQSAMLVEPTFEWVDQDEGNTLRARVTTLENAGAGAVLSNSNPLALGTAAPGTGVSSSRTDHVHPTTGVSLSGHTHAGYVETTGDTVTGALTISNTGSLAVVGATSTANTQVTTKVDGDTSTRWGVRADGFQAWGDGTASRDTNLYRSAANTLATDDNFDVGQSLTVGGDIINAGQLDFSASGGVAASVTSSGLYLPAGKGVTFEGTTDDAFETRIIAGDPTADRTITLPDSTGTVSLTSHTHTSFANNLQINKADSKVQLLNTTSGSGTEDGMYLLMADTDVGYLWNAETNGALVFGTGGAERARITPAGKFGIGTNLPAHQLEVVGPQSVTVGVNAGGAGFAQLELVGQSGKNYITSDDTLSFNIGGTERATVSTTGLNVTSGTLSQSGTAVSLSGHSHAAESTQPTGSIVMWPTATAPAGWLFLDGASYNQSTYPALAAVFGVPTGAFTLPDMRGAFLVGRDTIGALVEKNLEAQNIQPNLVYTQNHNHTTNIAHSHANTLAVGSHASHTHSVNAASFASGTPSASGAGQSGSGLTVPSAGHTHAIDVPATTSGAPSATLSHTITGSVTAQATTSTSSTGHSQTLDFVRTQVNFIIKT